MKNPGCANNRGPPLYTSGSLSYQIAPFPNAPAAMMLRAKAAYGDDDDDSLPRPACVQISTVPNGCLHSLFSRHFAFAEGVGYFLPFVFVDRVAGGFSVLTFF